MKLNIFTHLNKNFFQQLRTQFHSKTNSTAASQVSSNKLILTCFILFIIPIDRPIDSAVQSPFEKNTTFGDKTIPLNTGQRSRSVSTESLASTVRTSSAASTPSVQSNIKPATTVRSSFS